MTYYKGLIIDNKLMKQYQISKLLGTSNYPHDFKDIKISSMNISNDNLYSLKKLIIDSIKCEKNNIKIENENLIELFNNNFKKEKEFEEARKKIVLPTVDKEIMLNDYLIYWFEKIYIRKVDNNTAVLGSYTVYNLIIPNLPYDIKLRLTTTEYIDVLLEKIDKLGKSLANKAREYLHLIFSDAKDKDKLISSNPVETAKKYPRKKRKINILNKEEIKILLENSCESSWYLEILLGLFCGLRKGEI